MEEVRFVVGDQPNVKIFFSNVFIELGSWTKVTGYFCSFCCFSSSDISLRIDTFKEFYSSVKWLKMFWGVIHY